MIISQVIGGLGNQMFQYVVGRALSLRRRQPFSLENSIFLGYDLHQGFELKRVFTFAAEIAIATQDNRYFLYAETNISTICVDWRQC